jgi:hypothetical protein
VVSFTPRPLYPRVKSLWYPLDRLGVGPRTGLGDVERRKFLPLPGLEVRPLGRPASSQSLHRLSYPGPTVFMAQCLISEAQGQLYLVTLKKEQLEDVGVNSRIILKRVVQE